MGPGLTSGRPMESRPHAGSARYCLGSARSSFRSTAPVGGWSCRSCWPHPHTAKISDENINALGAFECPRFRGSTRPALGGFHPTRAKTFFCKPPLPRGDRWVPLVNGLGLPCVRSLHLLLRPVFSSDSPVRGGRRNGTGNWSSRFPARRFIKGARPFSVSGNQTGG